MNITDHSGREERLNEDDLERLLLDFRDLRCSVANHLAIQESKTSLFEIQKTLQDQFLTLTIGVLGLALTMMQAVVMSATMDLTAREVSGAILFGAFVLVVWFLINRRRTGFKAKLRIINQKIDSAADRRDEYATLKIVADDTILSVLVRALKDKEITQERYNLLKQRIDKVIAFYGNEISEAEEDLKAHRADKKKLEADC